MKRSVIGVLAGLCLMVGMLAACSPAATRPTLPSQPTATKASAPAQPSEAQKPQPTAAPVFPVQPTQAPSAPSAPSVSTPQPTKAPAAAATPTAQPSKTTTGVPFPTFPVAQPTSPVSAEERLVELEWPTRMSLGDSDVVRLALLPVKEGYVVRAEFPEHTVESKPLLIEKPAGYQLAGLARLDGPGFEIEPAASQETLLLVGKPVTWRWSLSPRRPGQQRLAVSLTLRWYPDAGSRLPEREQAVFSRAVEVWVTSFLGMSRGQALFTGFAGILFGGGLSLTALSGMRRSRALPVREELPNPRLALEPRAGMTLSSEESDLLRALFRRYARVVLHNEFLSGYSGARTFLAQPVLPDGRSDAFTIAKLGPEALVRKEYENYETYVKDSLPPVTARIQQPPVRAKSARSRTLGSPRGRKAALQYTFIAEPGKPSTSLRQALLTEQDPAGQAGRGLIRRLFETFGPNWWMQRRAYPFRLCQEYDHLLPPHYVLQPVEGGGQHAVEIGEGLAPARAALRVGDLARVGAFARWEPRSDGRSLTLTGVAQPGQPGLRLRWLAPQTPKGSLARVTATRESLFVGYTQGFDRLNLPDPLAPLEKLLQESVQGTRSTIHGDLNLENVLVGPGGLVWLIDFAATREGHPLYDFARLYAEIITQVIAERQAAFISQPRDFVELLRGNQHPYLRAVEEIARRCLFEPGQPREFHLALYLTCLGGLKFSNLNPEQKYLLYLAAGHFLEIL